MENRGSLKEEDLKEYMLKEMDIIQEIIKRMAFNSFLIKGWTVTLVSVALLLKGDASHVWIAFIPLLTFWYLDSYFLWQERAYRKLYDWVIEKRLETDELLFDMKAAPRFGSEIQCKVRIMFSETLLVFYGPILAILVIALLFEYKILSI